MSITQRKHIRLTLEIPAFRYNKLGEKIAILLLQISIGGCLIEWDETIEQSEEFRLEIQLPNKNWLPLHCKAIYKVKNDGIGAMFQDITQFEQELIVQVMSENLAENGIPFKVDPFAKPKTFVEKGKKQAGKNEVLETENDDNKVEALAVDD
jgi:hypothetical protein